jgi:hypothetical protein
MAGAGFTTFTAGSVLTAAQVNTYLMQQAVMVFTNEAARDAAITSPSEGMIAYLTAPTVPSASGDTYAATPTGVETIYNGSNWVCVTPVSATTNTTGTTSSATFTPTLTSGGTNPSVTLVTGTSVKIDFGAIAYSASATRESGMAIAVSGATTLSPSGAVRSLTSLQFGSYAYLDTAALPRAMNRSMVLTGLTAGTNTFTLNYITDNITVSFSARSITVQGIA